jgi:hypothetical protein
VIAKDPTNARLFEFTFTLDSLFEDRLADIREAVNGICGPFSWWQDGTDKLTGQARHLLGDEDEPDATFEKIFKAILFANGDAFGIDARIIEITPPFIFHYHPEIERPRHVVVERRMIGHRVSNGRSDHR